MAEVATEVFRSQLVERRHRLQSASKDLADQAYLAHLLEEVDAALQRLEQGTFGLCDTCHDPIEADRLLADPLMRLCVDHLTAAQKDALEQDLELARQVQTKLLPGQQKLWRDWETYYHYEPLGLVSGDYCDLIDIDEDRSSFLFITGDVSGKGIAASLLMSHLHAIFRTLHSLDLPLKELVARANRLFCESTLPSSFATLICAQAQAAGGVVLCNAGHLLPLHVRKGKAEPMPGTGLPLGMFCDTRYEHGSLTLQPGEALVLYTDGVTEARNPAGAEYGMERLSRAVSSGKSSAEEIAKTCLTDLIHFRSGAAQEDDLTLLVVRRSR